MNNNIKKKLIKNTDFFSKSKKDLKLNNINKNNKQNL